MTRNYYFKIKKDTKTWELMDKCWHWQDAWLEVQVQDEIIDLIGTTEIIDDLIADIECLTLRKVPEHLENQFRKDDGYGNFRARKNSRINKDWIEFCAKHDLYVYNPRQFTKDIGLAKWGNNKSSIDFFKFEDDYVLQINNSNKNATYYEKFEFDRIEEIEFLAMKIKNLQKEYEKKEKQENMEEKINEN